MLEKILNTRVFMFCIDLKEVHSLMRKPQLSLTRLIFEYILMMLASKIRQPLDDLVQRCPIYNSCVLCLCVIKSEFRGLLFLLLEISCSASPRCQDSLRGLRLVLCIHQDVPSPNIF